MLRRIKLPLLYILKYLGIFQLCNYYYRKHARILCYHGFSYYDEHQFRPKLFMTPEKFESRIQYLKKSKFNIVSLDEALTDRRKNYKIAFTMDDGWSGVYDLIAKMAIENQIPITVYVTSYYAENQIPVANVAISYMLWKSKVNYITLKNKDSSQKELKVENTPETVKQICDHIYSFEKKDRLAELLSISKMLEVNLLHRENFLFRLLNKSELSSLVENNFSLQLHTHRHRSPSNKEEFTEEININRQWLSQFEKIEDIKHFCFPNGEYQRENFEVLKATNIQSATITKMGLYKIGTDSLRIKRILDGENLSQIELEAELSGFNTFIRGCVGDHY